AWLAGLLAKEMLPTCWLPPEDIQYLRDRTRLRRALAQDRMRCAQRLHALLTHEGWPCSRGRLLSVSGQRWARSLALPSAALANVEAIFALITVLDEQLAVIDAELRQRARSDPRLNALCTIFGVGPVLAAHLLAEIGQADRFRRAPPHTARRGAPGGRHGPQRAPAPPTEEFAARSNKAPGTATLPWPGMSRRSPNPTSRAATASAHVGQGHHTRIRADYRTRSGRPPPLTRRPLPCRRLFRLNACQPGQRACHVAT